VDLLLWAFLGTPFLVGAGWRYGYAHREPGIPAWRSRALLIALSVVTANALAFYIWWGAAWGAVWLSVGSERLAAAKALLADNLTIYVALASVVPAALGKGPARICTMVAALLEVLLWSNVGIL
jgi:hypothetical protein